MQTLPNNFKYNHIYFPIVFNDKKQLINVIHCLNKKNPRRYFFPCTNQTSYCNLIDKIPISDSISKKIIYLPLDTYISDYDIIYIYNTINSIVDKNSIQKNLWKNKMLVIDLK